MDIAILKWRSENNISGKGHMKAQALLSFALINRKVLILTLVMLAAVTVQGQSADIRELVLNSSGTVFENLETDTQGAEEYFQESQSLKQCRIKPVRSDCTPKRPMLPRNFRWKGRYIVRDLIDPATGKVGVDVPFTWHGNNGDIQMIAGSEKHPIYFTNFIYDNQLYTYTYKWPGLQEEFLPPLEPCDPLFEFSLEDLNALLAASSYVGAEILKEKSRRHVHHFRLPIVLPRCPPGFYFRIPILLGDIYVDQKDSSKIWKLLHFGFQNIYDPNLDEWIVINKFEDCPGEIVLPEACSPCRGFK